MKKALLAIPALLVGFQFPVAAQVDIVPPGTEVAIRTNQWIDARNADGRIYTGTVDQDIRDRDGREVIPRGSEAELIARTVGPNEMVLDLESINANGRRYVVSATPDSAYGSDRGRQGVGENQRTAKYVGGGAVIGSIIGAIAGGGKGAAIGAAAGAATGAGAQMATRGREIRVPAESILTFRLDRPIRVVAGPDPGYTRDGYHYHNYPPNDRDRSYPDRDRPPQDR
jgi:hypothetical protein